MEGFTGTDFLNDNVKKDYKREERNEIIFFLIFFKHRENVGAYYLQVRLEK